MKMKVFAKVTSCPSIHCWYFRAIMMCTSEPGGKFSKCSQFHFKHRHSRSKFLKRFICLSKKIQLLSSFFKTEIWRFTCKLILIPYGLRQWHYQERHMGGHSHKEDRDPHHEPWQGAPPTSTVLSCYARGSTDDDSRLYSLVAAALCSVVYSLITGTVCSMVYSLIAGTVCSMVYSLIAGTVCSMVYSLIAAAFSKCGV